MSRQLAILVALAVVFLSSQLVKEGSVVDQLSDPERAAKSVAAMEDQRRNGRSFGRPNSPEQTFANAGGWSDLSDFSDPIDTAEGSDPTPLDEGGELEHASQEREPLDAPSISRPSSASDGVKIIYAN